VNPLEQSYEGARDQLAKDGGSIAEVKVSSNNTQAANNQAVVSYLQSHPAVTYLFTTTDDYSAGLPAALALAGVKVKIIAGSALLSDYAGIRDGSLFAGIGNSSAMGQWDAAYVVARLADGLTIPVSLQDPVGWLQVVTKANVGHLNHSVLQAANYQQYFTTAWKVG
jgi:ABC-type sugar transport system substrate-binding protein